MKEPSSSAKVASYKPVTISPEKRKVNEQPNLEKQDASIMLMSTVTKAPAEEIRRGTKVKKEPAKIE